VVDTSEPHVPVRGLIFDLDGVLTDTAELHYRAWKRLADAQGVAFDRSRNEALRGVSRAESLRRILDGIDVDDERFTAMLATKNADYVRSLDQLTPDDVLPGAREILAEARARGLRTVVGSSSRNAALVLERIGLLDALDAVVDGTADVPAKPAPDLFLLAAERIGLAADGCVVVEDATSGIDAAIAAGMRTVGIGPAERVGHADLVTTGLDTLELDAVLALPVRRR
jgi:beta-phosphoglucomutase